MPREMRADWVSVQQARDTILENVSPLPPERRPLLGALGYTLAEEIYSPLDLPPWDNSAMDGFAVRAADVQGACSTAPRTLPVVDDVPAGGFSARALQAGEAIRIMTGAPIPAGADSVIRVEHTDGGRGMGTPEARVQFISDEDAGRNIRMRGEDLREGALVLRKGVVLRAAEVGVAASVGRSHLSVTRRPTVAILASGDELVDLDGFTGVLAGRKIVSSNTYALAAQLAESGIESRILGIASDSPDSIRSHLEAAQGCDALITSAGISMGEHDLMRDVLLGMGAEVAFWRVRMRPGSPFAFGRIAALAGIPWFGLPGNPVSTMVTFELLVRPALLRICGRTAVHAPTVHAQMRDSYPARPGLTHFPRVRLHRKTDSPVSASLTGAQGSGILTSMAGAEALLVVPEDKPGAAPGDILPAIVLGGAPLCERAGY
jgi:molybdopterin molybdotransferase